MTTRTGRPLSTVPAPASKSGRANPSPRAAPQWRPAGHAAPARRGPRRSGAGDSLPTWAATGTCVSTAVLRDGVAANPARTGHHPNGRYRRTQAPACDWPTTLGGSEPRSLRLGAGRHELSMRTQSERRTAAPTASSRSRRRSTYCWAVREDRPRPAAGAHGTACDVAVVQVAMESDPQ